VKTEMLRKRTCPSATFSTTDLSWAFVVGSWGLSAPELWPDIQFFQ